MLLNKRIPVTYILNKVKFELLYISVLSAAIILLTDMYGHTLPEMPLTIPAFIGTAISILLSFKLNQSYDRWWEARKIWGSIVNDSRTLVMQLQGLAHKDSQPTVKKIAQRQIAWCYALGNSLRGMDPFTGIKDHLPTGELQQFQQHSNKPLAMLQAHIADIREIKEARHLDTFAHVQLDNTILRLCDAQGRAERIKSTVFPVTYRLFLHFIIYVFVITLSISLKNVSGFFEMPLLLVISVSFFLLERSATHMQDPFENKPTDTAVTAIARTIEINIRQLIGDNNVPEPLQPKSFYLT